MFLVIGWSRCKRSEHILTKESTEIQIHILKNKIARIELAIERLDKSLNSCFYSRQENRWFKLRVKEVILMNKSLISIYKSELTSLENTKKKPQNIWGWASIILGDKLANIVRKKCLGLVMGFLQGGNMTLSPNSYKARVFLLTDRKV